MKSHPARLLLLPAFLVCAASASAHTGHDGSTGFTAGLAHPLGGWDHLLAMVALGLWAATLGERARRGVPVAFLAVLGLAALAGARWGAVPALDHGAAASVLVLGLLVGCAARLPATAGLALAVIFAICHGWAHGAELPAGSSLAAYGAGFLLTSAALLAGGFLLGLAANRGSARLVRGLGWGIAASGLLVLAA